MSSFDKIIRKLEETWWRIWGYQIVECLGDLHVKIFRSLNDKYWVGARRFRTVSVQGATDYGVGNPNLKTNALQIFKNRLKVISKNRTLILLMGEVDVGFLAWWRSKRNKMDAMVCMEDTWQKCMRYLIDVKQLHPRLVVCSVPLPTIGDGETHRNIANAR